MRRALLGAVTMMLVAGPVTGQVTFNLDRSHTNIGFVVKHMMVTNVRGTFNDFTGSIVLDEQDITKSSVNVVVQAGSVDTNNERRDADLRSTNFFEVEKFPELRFASKRVEKTADGFVAIGDLTIRDVTREVRIPFELTGPINAGNRRRLGVEGSFRIVRQDYGLTWNNMVEAVPVVADEVRIELTVEAATPAARQ